MFCTGCTSCYNICSKKAINMEPDSKGFLYPKINDKLCVNCGLCKKVCPQNNIINGHENMHVYAALVKDDQYRAKSTSGGVFGCLARFIIKHGGYVYGAILDTDMIVRHIEASNYNDLEKIYGSKYVQSQVGDIFKMVKMRLDSDELVLFSGTPCQVAGIKTFLGKDYENLILVDILCHGVPSPYILNKYVRSEEDKAQSKMVDIQFRSKRIGWKKLYTVRRFLNNKEADWPDTFVPGFLQNLYLRDSCYECKYTNIKRQGDITLGDFWGYKESSPEHIEDDDRGISLVMINSKKGNKYLNKIHSKIALANRNIEDAKLGNPVLYKPCKKPIEYDSFWKDVYHMDWVDLCDKYINKQDTREWMSKEDRGYYSRPYVKRHRRHILHIVKYKLLVKLGK